MMIVRPLWRQALRHRRPCAAATALLLLVGLTHVSQAAAIAAAFAAVVGGSLTTATAWLGVVAVLGLLRLGLTVVQASAASRLGAAVRIGLRRRALASALSPRRLHSAQDRDGSAQAAVVAGVDGVDAYVSRYVPAVVLVGVLCPLVTMLLVLLHPVAGVVVGVAAILSVVGPLMFSRAMAHRGLDHWDSYEALSADLLEALRGMATLRALGDVPGTRARLHARSEALRRATERVMRVSLAETGVADLAIQAGVTAAAALAAVHAATGQPPALKTYLVLLLASEAFRPIRDLSRHWHSGFLGLTALPGLAALGAFDDDPAPDAADPVPGSHATGSSAADRPAERLAVAGVRATYPGRATAVLNGVDLTARRGALTALVGPSGAGKSTLFDVILGLLPPSEGRVLLDGAPLRPADVAVLSQRPVLFAGTVRENLDPHGERTAEELLQACRDAGVLDDVLARPGGLDAPIAEAGGNVSGGQRQRLALARALAARRPVLLVDEPTSALDEDRARQVLAALHRAARDRIVLMISHRPEALDGVQHVVALRDGRTEEVAA
ncbi:ATP-binding cassette domain-containing protein [Micrococcus luteus]|uniref:ATP-binding cassette domain-containing protein n=1 Tax=Micrococcus luteus TaxID=1270 RepID=UPI0021048977|nr:ATP-binding cassette domain-containing protein [Micrococcus luteus]UTX34837.1 ATP-binding cassette domain-containing protein [Micrococcus luteus]